MEADRSLREGRAETRAGGLAWPNGGFWKTVKSVLLEPSRFFSGMPTGDGYSAPLLFAVFWGVFAAIFGGSTHFGLITFDPLAWLISVLVAPVVIAAQTLIVSGLLHGSVRLWTGTNNAGFATTFRVLCYSTASYVMYVIPFVGPTIGAFYVLFLSIVGVRAAHSASIGKAVGMVLTAFVALLIATAVLGSSGPEVTDRTVNILLP